MHRPIIHDAHPILKLIFTLVIILAIGIITILIGFGVGGLIFGFEPLLTAMGNPMDPENVSALKYMQILQTVALFLIPAFVAAFVFHKRTSVFLYFSTRKFSVGQFLIVAIGIITLIPIASLLTGITQRIPIENVFPDFIKRMMLLEETYRLMVELFTNVSTIPALLINILMIAILPAIAEELIFRGVFQRFMLEWTRNSHLAIWITAALFSAIHMSYFGFLPRLMLGAFMGYLLFWSGSIWLPILAHFVNNLTGVIAYYLYFNGHLNVNPGDTTQIDTLFPIETIIALFALPMLMLYLYKSLRTIEFDRHSS